MQAKIAALEEALEGDLNFRGMADILECAKDVVDAYNNGGTPTGMELEHYERLKELQRKLSSFQNQYIIEFALEQPHPMWPSLLDELINANNALGQWETENI